MDQNYSGKRPRNSARPHNTENRTSVRNTTAQRHSSTQASSVRANSAQTTTKTKRSHAPVDTKLKKAQQRKAGRPKRPNIITILCLLMSAIIVLYPVGATMYNNVSQNKLSDAVRDEIAATQKHDPGKLARELERARQYNAKLGFKPLGDPWAEGVDITHDPEYQEYETYLNDFSAMATITIPSINSSLPIRHGTAPETLDRGIGHLYGSSLPVGGQGTHSVLTGHTGLRQATLWDNLVKVKDGDEIIIDVYGQRLGYRVYKTQVVLPTETEALMEANKASDELTLITCTPYGVNSHRLLVHAKRVDLNNMDITDKDVSDSNNFMLQWWMWIAFAIAGLVLGYLVWSVWLRQYLYDRKND